MVAFSSNSVNVSRQIRRAQVLAATLAAHLGVEVEHLAKTVSVGADAAALKVTQASEDAIKSMVIWWKMRGYSATAAPDGAWVNAGRARIRDTGDRLEIHGGLTDEAIAATITKARDAWGGGVYPLNVEDGDVYFAYGTSMVNDEDNPELCHASGGSIVNLDGSHRCFVS
jgi:hypothetical protein